VFEPYRKAIGSKIWHFCSNCSTWPLRDHIASSSPEQIGNEELCTECIARHQTGDCQDYDDELYSGARTCPVVVQGKRCASLLLPDFTAGLCICTAGHRILIVPPRGASKSD